MPKSTFINSTNESKKYSQKLATLNCQKAQLECARIVIKFITRLVLILAPIIGVLGFGFTISFGINLNNKLSTLFKIIIPILASLVVIFIEAGVFSTIGTLSICIKDKKKEIKNHENSFDENVQDVTEGIK